ncbi:MAG: DNA polymerase I [Dehalococcoidales bacterium]|nr:DNA polymerase I [Dehalococcoidales bacterium]
MKKPLLVLFDGNALVHRAFHAFEKARPLTLAKTGEVISAVYGFTLMLLKVFGDLKPTHAAVAFDKKGPTFRHELYHDYKAQRPATPEELVNQLSRVKQVVAAFNIPIFEMDSYEADDVLGALARQAGEQDMDAVIVTGDADSMQLVSPRVKVLYPRPGKSFGDTMLYDETAVSEKFGVPPKYVADYKGLVGDTSDNIPGVTGIGEKTAVKLIRQFGGIEQMYEHLDEVTPTRVREILKQQEDAARQSKKLATIVTELPLKLNLEDCRLAQYDRNKVTELFRELGFYSLMSKLPEAETASASEQPMPTTAKPVVKDYHIISTITDLENMVDRLTKAETLAFDTETDNLNPMAANLVGISLSPTPGEAYYLPVGHLVLSEIAQLPKEDVIRRLKPLLEDGKIPKVAHNGNYDMTVLAESGIDVRNLLEDTLVAAYLLGEKSQGLKALAFSKLAIEMTAITDLIGTGAKQLPMSRVDIKDVGEYSCTDADMTIRLSEVLGADLRKEGLWKLFSEVEVPLVPVLVEMQRNGVALDTDLLQKMSLRLGEQLRKLELEIYNNVGHQFNINSPRQLGVVLFDELHLGGERRGKNRYSTDAGVLEELRGTHPVIAGILEYRQLSKIKSTYVDALPELINPKTGRVHTSFNQTRTTTGRLSSSDPNLQNIPVRGDLGKEVRHVFIAPEGSYLLAGDYSQIDLRALAHLSKDDNLVAAFTSGADIHSSTAAQLFNVEPSKVTADMRRLAKTVNFGVIYGMSDYGLEQATEMSREQAGKFITAYFEKYPGVKKYLEGTKEKVRRDGYVETILGRRRYIPEINSPNRLVREAAERMAINMPVQGTSADIIKVAMVKLHAEMAARQLRSKMLLQVHDELIFEVPEAELEAMRKLVPDIMSEALKLDVPIKVDIKQGKNWGQME